jgi:SAM-dependent methyltransferase
VTYRPARPDIASSGIRAAMEEAHRAGVAALRVPASETFPRALRRLERISLRAIQALLAADGALPPDGPARTVEETAAVLRAAPRHVWLVGRWLAALAEEGAVSRTGGRYLASGDPAGGLENAETAGGVADERAMLRDCYAALGFPPTMARFHEETLARLGELVRDEVTIQQLLFRDGDVLAALAAYQDNVFTDYLNAACGRLLRHVAQRGPAPLRVVELGGGGGGATAAALRALRGVDTDYVFTDISRAFTAAARERFGDLLSCRPLDIDADLHEWGMPPESADVVLAANVLHNAVHIGRTLGRIRRVLRPGGVLVFTESTRENHVILTSMQFLLSAPPGRPGPGGADRRSARGEVFLDAAGWHEELAAAGLTPVFTLPEAESPLAVTGQYLFYADAR